MIKLTRYPGNPVLKANPDNAWEAQNVSNAGAVIHEGKVYLLYRAEGFEPRADFKPWPVASLGLATSSDGYNFERFDKPVLERTRGYLEDWAVEDSRIAKIDDTYYITYVGNSLHGDHIALATTKDFKRFEKHGALMPYAAQNTSGLFPKKINGKYVLMHRIVPSMWISYSDDLKTWTNTTCILSPKPGTWYDCKLGIGATPIEMEDSWVVFWHGRDATGNAGMYRLGILWLDKEDPTKIIKLQEEPVLEIEEDYEREGYYPNVVYTCGAVEKDGQFLVYYGCGDRCLAVATVPVDDVKKELRR